MSVIIPFPVYDPEDQVVVVDRVPLDDLTYARLQEVSDGLGLSPQAVIAGILHDVLDHDAMADCDDDIPDIVRLDANKDLN